jgi:hypothetical protein
MFFVFTFAVEFKFYFIVIIAASFDFGWCSLAQEMSFVDHYLPYFRQWLISPPCQPVCLSSLCLLEFPMEISSFLLPPSLVSL